MNPKNPGGTTVALNTKAWAATGTPHGAATTFTSRVVLNGGDPAGSRESITRQGATVYSDSPPAPGGAKYPLMSITRSVALVAYTSINPMMPAGMIAAFAVMAPVSAFNVDAKGCTCPSGQTVM